MRVDWPGQIEKDGRLTIRNKGDFDAALKSFPQDCAVYVSVSDSRPSRSSRQNSYYWGVVLKIASDETGYTADEMHEICKAQFLKRTYEIGFEDITATKSTRTLDTREMTVYIEQVRAWLAQNGINTPNPKEHEDGTGTV